MTIEYDNDFDKVTSLTRGTEQPYQVFPALHKDERGWFQEVMKGEDISRWVQINRSASKAGVVRGCHAQRGKFCQAKLVEAVNETLYDVITDCRPLSKTFGKTKIYCLDPWTKQNKLYVPHGFLHAFIVPHNVKGLAYFNYYCDAPYDKASEVCVNPKDIIPQAIQELVDKMQKNGFRKYEEFLPLLYAECGKSCHDRIYSEKDCNGTSFEAFTKQIISEMTTTMCPWYEGHGN